MNITTIGKGNIGGGLAKLWKQAGHNVTTLGSDGGDASGLGYHGQIARRNSSGHPDAQVRDAFPGQARRVPPEQAVNDQLAERRQVRRRGRRQDFHRNDLS